MKDSYQPALANTSPSANNGLARLADSWNLGVDPQLEAVRQLGLPPSGSVQIQPGIVVYFRVSSYASGESESVTLHFFIFGVIYSDNPKPNYIRVRERECLTILEIHEKI